MDIRTLILSLTLACGLAACTTAAREPEPRPDLDAIAAATEEALTVERVVEPTDEMLAAALTGDPVKMQQAVALTGCQAPSTCPSSFGSCSSWSAPTQCSMQCQPASFCSCPWPPHPDDNCEPDPSATLGIEGFNSFRVCFNASGQSCTEWNRFYNSYCGC